MMATPISTAHTRTENTSPLPLRESCQGTKGAVQEGTKEPRNPSTKIQTTQRLTKMTFTTNWKQKDWPRLKSQVESLVKKAGKPAAREIEPKDSIEALIRKSATALSLTNSAKEKAKTKQAPPKPKRSLVRKQRKVRVAGARRKQKRKGVN